MAKIFASVSQEISEREKRNMERSRKIAAQGIVLLENDGTLPLCSHKKRIALFGNGAVVLMSQPGNMGGHALADVLTGKVSPSGHLTATWARHYQDYPQADSFSFQNGNLDDEYYKEGIYVGYRYFDTFGVSPAYPFGYGKSYTEFASAVEDVKADARSVKVTAKVTNTGTVYSGREVVQVYYSAPAGRLEKPYQELAAFAKTKELAPGESEILTLSYPTASMASYDTKQAAFVMEAGSYYIRVGTHSRNKMFYDGQRSEPAAWHGRNTDAGYGAADSTKSEAACTRRCAYLLPVFYRDSYCRAPCPDMGYGTAGGGRRYCWGRNGGIRRYVMAGARHEHSQKPALRQEF